MPFGRGSVKNKGRMTQRTHAAALQRMAEARSAGITRRISAPGRAKSKANKVPQVNEREPPPNRGTVRSNQDQIAISMVNNKLNTLLELLNVDDPNTNIIMTVDQLNVRLDNLIDHIKEKRKAKERERIEEKKERSAERRERDRDEQAHRIRQNIRHGAYD